MRLYAITLLCWVIALPASIITDGTLTEQEWGPSAVADVPVEGVVLLVRDEEALHVGLRAPSAGLVNINLWRGDELRVLHQSGSLGRAVYRRTEGSWKRTEDFQWRLKIQRDPDKAALAARLRAKAGKPAESGEPRIAAKDAPQAIAAHFEEHGWTAATGPSLRGW